MPKLYKGLLSVLVAIAAVAYPTRLSAAYHFGVNGFGGYSSSTVPNGYSSPTLNQFGLGAAAGFGFRGFMLGAATDYRWISQTSDLANGVGNRRGARWNVVSPALFIFFKKFFIQLEAQLLGEYKLTNLTPEGAAVIFKRPIGAKVAFGIPLSHRFYLGAFVESVLFRSQTVTETKELHPPLNLWSTGLQLIWTPGRSKR